MYFIVLLRYHTSETYYHELTNKVIYKQPVVPSVSLMKIILDNNTVLQHTGSFLTSAIYNTTAITLHSRGAKLRIIAVRLPEIKI